MEALSFTPGGAIFNLGRKRKDKKKVVKRDGPFGGFCTIVLSGNPPGYKSSDKTSPTLTLSPARCFLFRRWCVGEEGVGAGGGGGRGGRRRRSAWVIIVLSTFIKPLRGKAKEWQTNILHCHRRHKTPCITRQDTSARDKRRRRRSGRSVGVSVRQREVEVGAESAADGGAC